MADNLDEYRSVIEEWTAQALDPYIERLDSWPRYRVPQQKEFNDAVWGTLTLHPLEVVILDSPILQRLRFVSQLGVVHFVYPTAGHTRLEHSLGAMHIVDRLITAMNEASHDEAGTIKVPLRRLVRLAALCHDVGHGLMSHVSENALREVDAVEDLVRDFQSEHGDNKRLGEINSALILGAPAFATLIQMAEELTGDKIPAQGVADKVRSLVLGECIDPARPTIQELISGPFDADKLDYMTRDARMSGVPVVTDVNRLVQKARSTSVATADLPPDVARPLKINHRQTTVVITGIAQSGNRTLDELTLGRTLLFDKIYRHQKVRSSERMVASIFRQIEQLYTDGEADWKLAVIPLLMTDDEIQNLDRHWPTILKEPEADEEQRAAAVARDLSAALRNRYLWVRCAAFSMRMTGDPYDVDPGHLNGLSSLIRELGDAAVVREISDELAAEAAAIMIKLDAGDLLARFPGGSLSGYVAVDRPVPPPSAPSSKALLISNDGRLVPFDVEAPETPGWANSYHQTRERGYVFAPLEVAEYVSLATQVLLRTKFGIRLSDSFVNFGHGNTLWIDERRAELNATGYFDTLPYDMRPEPLHLALDSTRKQLDAVASGLIGYMPPLSERTAKEDYRPDPAGIRSWVAQFGTDDLSDAAIRCLEKLHFVGRRAINQVVRAFLESHPEYESAVIVPLGTAKDSSAINTYYALDVADAFPDLVVMSLPDAITSGRPILMIDDVTVSGRQGASIISAWFGDFALAQEMGEQREAVAAELQDRLRNQKVAMLFCAAFSDGLRLIASAAHRHGLTSFEVHASLVDDDVPSIDHVDFESEAQKETFVSCCRDFGAQLIGEHAKQADRALGYGNKGLLLVFPYNTPSQSLTCLWEQGDVNGRRWEPLLPRRRKA